VREIRDETRLNESWVESRAAQGVQQIHEHEYRETSRQRREHTKERGKKHTLGLIPKGGSILSRP
jgi:hypothetical protein